MRLRHNLAQGLGAGRGVFAARTSRFVTRQMYASAEHGRRYGVIWHQAAAAALDWGAIRELLGPPPERPAVARPAGDGSGMIARLAG